MPGGTSLTTAFEAGFPVCFCKTPQGDLFITNGVSRPVKWDGLAAAPVTLGFQEPSAAPTITLSTGGAAKAGKYYLAYRWSDKYGNFSNLSPVDIETATANQKFSWSVPSVTSGTDAYTKAVKVELYRGLVGVQDPMYLVTTLDWDNAGVSYDDTLDDTTLSHNAVLPILNSDQSLNANRFVPPPSQSALCAWFQDRIFYAGNVSYPCSVTLTNGSNAFTISGGTLQQTFVDRVFYTLTANGSTKSYQQIATVTDSTTGTLTANFDGTTGTYSAIVRPLPIERNRVYFGESNEPESVPQSQNYIQLQETNGATDDDVVGLMPLTEYLYIFKRGHIHRATYVTQPNIDINAPIVGYRGIFNNECWDWSMDNAYCIDEWGAYSFDGQNLNPISDAIQNYWRDGIIDFAQSDKFFVRVNIREQVVRFYVAFAGDTSDRPINALCYNYSTQRWWTEKYSTGLGTAVLLESAAGDPFYIAADSSERWLKQSGASDIITTAVKTTCTAVNAVTGRWTDSNASFVSTWVNVPVYVASASSVATKALIGTATYIDAHNLSTTINATFAVGDVLIIGGIPWQYRTGRMMIPRSAQTIAKSINVWYAPTAGTTPFDIRHYLNFLADPVAAGQMSKSTGETCDQTYNSPDGTWDMLATVNPLGTSPGFIRKNLSGAAASQTNTDRWITGELRGVQVNDRVQISLLEIEGAQDA